MFTKETYDLSTAFEKRIGLDAAGLLVINFTGIPGSVTIKLQDKITPIEVVRGLRLRKSSGIHFTLKNSVAQEGIVELMLASEDMLDLLNYQTIEKPNASKVATGRVSVGTSATQFPDQAVPSGIAVVIVADSGNTDPIYIGGSNVTTTTGQELLAGDSIRLWVNNVNAIYAVAGVTGQYARYIVEVA